MVAPQHGGGPALRPRLRALVQRQARALGDPTRFTIHQDISEAPAPVRVAELARHLQRNPTAVRQHLANLCDARLPVGLLEGLGADVEVSALVRAGCRLQIRPMSAGASSAG